MSNFIYGEELRAKNGGNPIDLDYPIVSSDFLIATQVTRDAIRKATHDDRKYVEVKMRDGSTHHIGTHFMTTTYFNLSCYNQHNNHPSMNTTDPREELLRSEINLLDVVDMRVVDTPYPKLQ